MMKAVALTCARCTGLLEAFPGVALGVCPPCGAAWDFASGEKRLVPIEEAVAPVPPDVSEILRLPFIRFEASGAGGTARVYVMAFGISRIGTPHDDGSKMTMDAREFETRPGRLDAAPELGIETAAGLARYLALRRLDPDAGARLRPVDVVLRCPALLAVPFRVVGPSVVDPITGMTFTLASIGRAGRGVTAT